MNSVGRTLWYFLAWGTLDGLVLGTWSTTLMFPALGTMYGMLWGTGIGAACGLMCGLLVALIQAYTFHPDIDLPTYNRRLSRGIGVLVAIMGPLALMATSRNVLWGESFTQRDGQNFLISSLTAVIIWGGLAAAYTAYGYPIWLARLKMKQKPPSKPRWGLVTVMSVIPQKSLAWVMLLLGAGIGAAWQVTFLLQYRGPNYEMALSELLGGIVSGAICGIIAFAIITIMFLFGAGVLIMFLRRILFSDEAMSDSQRLFLTGSVTLFTGLVGCWSNAILSTVPWGGTLPILAALLMGYYVYQGLPSLDIDSKAKRKEAASLAVE